METLSYEEFKKRYGTVGLAQAKNPGFVDRVKENIKSGVSKIVQGQKQFSNPTLSPYDKVSGALKGGAGLLETVGAPASATLQPVIKPTLGRAVEYAADKISDSKSVQRFADSKWGKILEAGTEDVSNIANIAGTVGGSRVVGNIYGGASKTVSNVNKQIVSDVKTGIQQAPKMFDQVKKMTEATPPKPVEAMGQVLQGKTDDIATGFKGLRKLDLKDVKTYGDFSKKIDEGIGSLAKEVDDHLLKDPKSYGLKDLEIKAKTKGGKPVKMDAISRSLEQLEELYTSIGDDVEAGNIRELMNMARTKGLTRKQVNDIAREYGSEFKSKAFSKTGDALTSTNAQKFEMTRKGLKTVARKGLDGTTQKLDETMSALYRVQKLVKKNEEAVNTLKQKIQERGLLEKAGHHLSKVTDILSGGSLRGIIGGLLPRGAGYKTMNALDLEQVLQRNLDIIEKAVQSGDDATVIKILERIDNAT